MAANLTTAASRVQQTPSLNGVLRLASPRASVTVDKMSAGWTQCAPMCITIDQVRLVLNSRNVSCFDVAVFALLSAPLASNSGFR